MKKIVYGICLLALFVTACEEKEIVIPELSSGARRVLVEEITGVNCSNCPDGARELAALQKQIGADKLILVAIHSGGDLSKPVPQSTMDLQTTEGYALVDYIGQLSGIPSAAISRRYFPDEGSEFAVGAWSARITNEFKRDYNLDLFVANTYDPITRKLDIKVNMAPDSTLLGEHRLTVVITEDSIVNAQNDNSVIILNYVHRHAFRDIVTAINGDLVAEPLTAGALISKTYSLTLPAAWDDKHCTVVAYLHHGGTPDKIILQAAEDHVVE